MPRYAFVEIHPDLPHPVRSDTTQRHCLPAKPPSPEASNVSVQNERNLTYHHNLRQRKTLNKRQSILWKNGTFVQECDFPHIQIVCRIT